jgi:hypothetical protein
LQILFASRALADHHELGVGISLTEYNRRSAGSKRTASAGKGDPFNIGEPGHGDPSYRAACSPPPISVNGC